MKGITLPRMSSEATPGYPAPLTACMVTAITVSRPKRWCERREGEDEADGRAVGIGHDVAARFLAPALNVDQLDVAAVDFWDDQRHVFLHAQSAGIRYDGAAGLGEAGLEFGGDRGVERGEDDFGRAFRCGRRNLHCGHGLRNWSLQAPAGRVCVNLAFGSVRGRQPGDFEPGMVLQHLDESLSDNAGRAENADRNFGIHRVIEILPAASGTRWLPPGGVLTACRARPQFRL